MDPLYYQVNQTRLTENTQKTSDNLRMQSNKEAKEKASRRAADLDDTELSADINSMGEDLLGSMDPDLFGGRGSKAFRQMWEEELAKEEEPNREDEEGSGSGGGSGSGSPDSRDEHSPPEEQAAAAPPASPDPSAAEPVAGVPVDIPVGAGGVPGEVQREKLEEEREAAAEPPSPVAAGPPPPAAARAGRTEVPALESVALSKDAAKVKRAAADRVESSQPEIVAKAAGDKHEKSGGILSLLDLSSGFLIAEEMPTVVTTAESDLEAAEAALAEEPTEEVAPDLAHILDKLILGDASSSAYRRLQLVLGRFGAGVLRACVDSHVKVYLLPEGVSLTSHPLVGSAVSQAVDAAYLPGSRACVFEESCLTRVPYGFHPVLFYFAHAFDHALGGEEFASVKSPAVQASYQACLDGPHRFADALAANSPVHYFAQAVESFLSENDATDPIWTRQDLYDFDRSMYEYVEYLFRRKNGP